MKILILDLATRPIKAGVNPTNKIKNIIHTGIAINQPNGIKSVSSDQRYSIKKVITGKPYFSFRNRRR